MPAPRKYPLELRERAVRMYRTAEICEVYRDEDAFQAHFEAPYGGPFNTVLAALIEEDASVLTFLVPVG